MSAWRSRTLSFPVLSAIHHRGKTHRLRRWSTVGGALVLTGASLALVPLVGAADRADPARATVMIRQTPTADLGIDRPTGLAFVPDEGVILSGASGPNGGRTALSWTTADEDVTPASVPNLAQPATLTYDQRNSRFVGADRDGPVVATRQSRNSGPASRRRISPEALAGARASAVDPNTGAWYVVIGDELLRVPTIDGAIGSPERVKLKGGIKPTGLAFNPRDGLLYAYDGDKSEVVTLSPDGTVTTRFDLSGAQLRDVRGMAFAPSGDATDSPDTLSLFVADSGDAVRQGAVVEASLAAAVAPAAPVSPATLRATVNTSSFSPPAPDPAGIAFLSAQDNLLISDSEVDEMPIFAGANLYRTTRSGSLASTGLTNPPTREPTGLAYDSTTGTLYVSDDDRDRIYIDRPGPDGRHGTGDDTWSSVRTDLYGGNDAEDVGYDPVSRDLFQVDGTNREVYRLNRGPNGVFDGVAPVGDDSVSQFDVARYGAVDPEGIHYDAARQMLFVVDEGSAAVYRLTPEGQLLATISIASLNTIFAADVVVAPASAAAGDSIYIVDRGIDNNAQANENDGRMFEVGADLGGAQNQPPSVNAGPDQTISLVNAAQLSGQVTDDGLPSNSLSAAWAQQSGPGTVTFANANAAATSATFSAAGSYVLRLTASDTALSAFDEVTINVQAASAVDVDLAVSASNDDAEEFADGTMVRTSSDLELVFDGSNQTVGMRFVGVAVPRNATIVEAWVQFQVDEAQSEPTALTISAQAADNGAGFLSASFNLSSRPRTAAAVGWSPQPWSTIGEAGPNQRTPDLSPVVQEVVNRGGWNSGNAMVLIVTGTGHRTATSFNGAAAPRLHIRYAL